MTDGEIRRVARDMYAAMEMAEINPAKDSLASVIDKFRDKNWRHLMLHLENGGMVILCANPEMSRRLSRAVQEISQGMDSAY